MRATVTNASAPLVEGPARGAGIPNRTFLLRNRTNSASVFLEVDDPATTSGGFEMLTSDSVLRITLEPGQVLNAIRASNVADQTIDVLAAGELA